MKGNVAMEKVISAPPLIHMENITKEFAGVVANRNIDFDVKRGEVHALLGENGAGKSTLMNILYGLYRPDKGHVCIDGKSVSFSSPKDAIASGIGMVHQHFMLIPSQTVWENMILGLEGLPQILPRKEIHQKIIDISEQYGLEVDPDAKIWQLSIGEQQRVAILQMLYRRARVLILDEPTAVLTPQESLHLFKTIRQMTAEGHGIVFISHKLDEVLSLSDRITILRKGEKTGTVQTQNTSKEQLAELMMGRKVTFTVARKSIAPGKDILKTDNITVLGERGLPTVKNISIAVKEREILGLAGIAGNGQQELCEALAGLRPLKEGRIFIENEEMTHRSPKQYIDRGIRYIPADRKGTGLVPNMDVKENSILKKYWNKPVAKGPMIDWKAVFTHAMNLVKKYSVSTPSMETPVKNLSGGNLQKLMLGRELCDAPKALIAVHPTWGLDVAATHFVREQLLEERDRGAAIFLVSEDLEELLSLSDRLAVIFKGEIMGILNHPEEATPELIGLMMAGTPLSSIKKGAK
ncbi:MAG: ABC transporter ATP-binding protein [Aminobacterium sp.]|nr:MULTISPECIES: ABC transporter ATP-binding protein [unclassified Aminobacterium]MEA4877773.1 ABC transporter ATP-binding protein [Aminobacterium sp.]WMI71103.1 ABC transporter ATP-binding protein [Aminobacterium sp. MB27-C1]